MFETHSWPALLGIISLLSVLLVLVCTCVCVFKTRKRRALLQVQRESARGRLQYLRGENNEWSGTIQWESAEWQRT